MATDWSEEAYEEMDRLHEQLLSRFRVGMLYKLDRTGRLEMAAIDQCLASVREVINMLPNEQATEFWETIFEESTDTISDPVRHMLRAAYRKRAMLNRAKARTGDLFEEDALGTLNISFEPVPIDSVGRVYLEQRPPLEEKPHERYPNMWAGMGAVVDHYEKPEEAWARVVKKFVPARIVQAVPVPLEGIFPRHVFDPDRGPFVLHVIAVLLDSVPSNPRGRFFTQGEAFQLDLVASHRNIILPAAFHWHNEVGFYNNTNGGEE